MARKKPHGLAARGAGDTSDYSENGVQMQDEHESGIAMSPPGAMSDKEKFDAIFEETTMRITAADFVWPEYEDVFEDGRQRAWWFILYPESMNPNTFSILSDKGIQAAVSPLHDSDYWPDGTKKKPHFHVIIYVPGKAKRANLDGLMKVLGGVMLEPIANIVGACRYLAHLDIQPDKVEADRGKVRYSVEDIVTFNGFDVMTYIKATATQISRALKELYVIIEERDITAYWTFIKYIYSERPEYEFVMANPHVCRQVEDAIKSRYAINHKNDLLVQQGQVIERQQEHINMLMGGLDRLMMAFEQMGVRVKPTDSETPKHREHGATPEPRMVNGYYAAPEAKGEGE